MSHLQTMSWDYQDNFKSADLGGGGEVYYVYDSSGERIRKVVEKQDGDKEERIYLGGYEVYRKIISGEIKTDRTSFFVSDGNKTIAQIDTLDKKNTIRYQYDNHLGSASLELNDDGGFISYEEYHPFGTTSYRSGKNESEVSLKRYKYVGKERDEETGLYYYGARYYSAWLGRFVSVDPLQFKFPFYTPYQYSGNNPMTFYDLNGRETDKNDKTGSDVNGPQKESEANESANGSFILSNGVMTPNSEYSQYQELKEAGKTTAESYFDYYAGKHGYDPTSTEWNPYYAGQLEFEKLGRALLFKLKYNNDVADAFIMNYAYGNGKDYELTLSEFKEDVGVKYASKLFGLQDLPEGKKAIKEVIETGKPVNIALRVKVYAIHAGTLGNYYININGKVSSSEFAEWSFTGRMEFTDIYDFNPSNRGEDDEEKVRIARHYLYGKPFKVIGNFEINQNGFQSYFDIFKQMNTKNTKFN